MPELAMTVVVTREILGLSDLHINDHLNYVVSGGDDFLGAGVAFNRTTAESPFLDGSVIVAETRALVQEQLALECYGDSVYDVFGKMHLARQAFTQHSYQLKIGHTIPGGVTWWMRYACHKADYKLGWTGPRAIAHQMQAVFTVPRQPLALQGPM